MTSEKENQRQRRQHRLSQQLRANLIRRKEQLRKRCRQVIPFYHANLQGRNEDN